jgi:hypothetical protein
MSCIKRRVQSIRMQASLIFSTSVKRCIGIAVVFFVAGCASSGQISGAIAAYQAQAPRIELGQSMEQVFYCLLSHLLLCNLARRLRSTSTMARLKRFIFFAQGLFPMVW